MVLAAQETAAEREQRVVLSRVPWHAYVSLRDTLDDAGSHVRITYLDGEMEIVSPSDKHEEPKKLLARLLEAWAEENDVDLNGHGSQTFRDETAEAGLEPDECYSRGPFGRVPDIAIEVTASRPLRMKLVAYARLGIREVWVWERGALAIHVLASEKYELRDRSVVLPELDVAHLAGFVEIGASQTKTVKAFRAELRSRLGAPGH